MRAVAVALLLVAGDAAAQPYRYVDEQGQVHYVARRDQVPERYRGQLGPAKPGEPAKPLLTPNPGGRAGAPWGCACRKALQGLSAEEAGRAECFASSVEDELGKRSR